jgi:hypothetical protein
MIKAIRNVSRKTVKTHFKNEDIVIPPKGVLSAKDDSRGEQEKLKWLLDTYGFLRDATPKVKHPLNQEAEEAKGVRVR